MPIYCDLCEGDILRSSIVKHYKRYHPAMPLLKNDTNHILCGICNQSISRNSYAGAYDHFRKYHPDTLPVKSTLPSNNGLDFLDNMITRLKEIEILRKENTELRLRNQKMAEDNLKYSQRIIEIQQLLAQENRRTA